MDTIAQDKFETTRPSSHSPDYRLRLVCVGDAGVGKTSALLEFLKPTYEPVNVPLNIYHKTLRGCNLKTDLMFWDTAGQPEYDRLRPLAYPQANAILVFYSVCDSVSFENVFDRWIPEIQVLCPGVPFILVGCKADRRDRRISYRTGLRVAAINGAHAYTECSAEDGTDIHAPFMEAIHAARNPSERNIFKQLGQLRRRLRQLDPSTINTRSLVSETEPQERDTKREKDPALLRPFGW